jgi:hypothetical protein
MWLINIPHQSYGSQSKSYNKAYVKHAIQRDDAWKLK